MDVFLAYLDHGNAKNASYQYIVVPSVSASALEAYAKKSPLEIVSNTSDLQAVRHNQLGLTQAVFYTAGRVTLQEGTTLSVESPSIVMVKMNGKKVTKISVVDPTHKLSSLKLTLNAKLEGSGLKWSIAQQGSNSVITVQLPTEGYAGQTVVMEFN